MDLRATYFQVDELIEAGKFSEAEDIIVPIAENPQAYLEWSCSFINSLVYSILIPQGRFIEALAWLDDSIQGDYGYESWNSVSNLGHLMIKLGDITRAEKLFRLMLAANTGPIDEAKEFLELIASGRAKDLVVSKPENRESIAYKTFYDYMVKNGIDDSVLETFEKSRGGSTYGFVSGIMSNEGIKSLNPTNDQVAQAFLDYMTHEKLEKLPTYEEAAEAARNRAANASHRRVLRESAIEGSAEAAYLLYEAIKSDKVSGHHAPWLQVAKSRGYSVGLPKRQSALVSRKKDDPSDQSWSANLKRVLGGTATRVQFVDAITHWFKTEIAESTEGMWEAVSRRVVWQFPDGHMFAVGTGFSPVLYHFRNQITASSKFPLDSLDKSVWEFSSMSNGWAHRQFNDLPSSEEIVELVDLISAEFGEPSLLLPWGPHWTESIVDDEESYYEDFEDEDSENNYRTMFELASAIVNGEIKAQSPWALEFASDEGEGLSLHSDFHKFQKFAARIFKDKLVILNLDEHCAACGSGVYEDAVARDPDLKGKAIFRTWGQNSEWRWLGNGGINVEAQIESPELEKQLKEIAEEIGLDMGLSSENWQPTGTFSFVSSDMP